MKRINLILILGVVVSQSNAQIKTRVTPANYNSGGHYNAGQVNSGGIESVYSHHRVDSAVYNSSSGNSHEYQNGANRLPQSEYSQPGQNIPVYNQNRSYPVLPQDSAGQPAVHQPQHPNNGYHLPGYGRSEEGSHHSANWEFENKTVQRIEKGICYKEVETASLIKDSRAQVPVGNGTRPNLSRVQVCCEGYERNIHNFYKCEPICRKACINGICVAPDKCACYPDHVLNLAGYCVPTCPIGCANGDCDGSSCVCKPGYVIEQNEKFCVPRCGKGCGFGNCTAPDTCVCDTGYQISPDKICKPKCSKGCTNGDCTAPEVCVCRQGYTKTESGCEPDCDGGCRHGRCVAPNECQCEDGYTLDSSKTKCLFHCDQPCYNGICTGPNTCSCNQGYLQNSYGQCIPDCPNGCPNGVCTAPNRCLCNAGFVKDVSIKGAQRCVPHV